MTTASASSAAPNQPDPAAASQAASTAREPRLKHFPVAFFAIVMGLTGVSIAWHKAQSTFGIPVDMAGGLLGVAIAVFAFALLLYLVKLLRFPQAVMKELGNPVQLNFVPTISISLLLLSIALLDSAPAVAQVLWMLGTAIHLVLTIYVMSAWMHQEHFEVHHINPAWFIPIVGNVLVPIAGVPLGYAELSWFFFSIGMLFWLVLLTIIIYRMLFHHPLPERLMPTLFILIAPPAVGFIAYARLSGLMEAGSPDAFARILYYSGLFLTLLLATQIGRFLRIQFYLSWWAYSFPLAAITIATLMMYELTGLQTFAIIGWVLLAAVTLVVLFLLFRTAQAIGAKQICMPHV
ncbi:MULTISPECIES: SLAC1 anion channel family protein [Thiorhodovibrio]|uniref:SLAC1 anion channel family protein n=1 Tax=Thiorhodovibrio TaxID=61593 RepID=UPI001911476D|nr:MULTISPECIES: SLAC1 anion channel family protein [Thiorhodovibrio]MBK5968025.1 C4-dicarboxylate ABC transporter [Thiorhodovibrio winogradskyi]WPL11842.1 Tellurite resistance protein TehA [Thiorhodovibrio litoralis]